MRSLHRGAGIVMPLNSLPNPTGLADFSNTGRWLVWLRQAGMRYWQILPLTIPDSVGSPFASPSAEALNPLLISLDWLAEEELLTAAEVRTFNLRYRAKSLRVVRSAKMKQFQTAWVRWSEQASPGERRKFLTWRHRHPWLEPYCLYQALKDQFNDQPWWQWPRIWQHGPAARQRVTPALRRDIEWQAWAQWQLIKQWDRVRVQAKAAGVTIIGDLPFYVQHDSVDVWQRPELFLLDRHRRMKMVSGAAPDVFSRDGQKWGTPVYRWTAHRREHWAWWLGRIDGALQLYDVIRFDHFPGYQATWHVPLTAKNGATGAWVPTPGRELLRVVRRRFGDLPCIAEDLGRVSKVVTTLRHDFQIPGSRVLQFAWSGLPNNFHEPQLVEKNMVYYTANHDTNTTKGWLEHEARWYEKKKLRETYGSLNNLPWKFIKTVMGHRAKVAMLHMADVLNLGQAGRINHPGTIRRNWSWQIRNWPRPTTAQRLRRLAKRTGRIR